MWAVVVIGVVSALLGALGVYLMGRQHQREAEEKRHTLQKEEYTSRLREVRAKAGELEERARAAVGVVAKDADAKLEKNPPSAEDIRRLTVEAEAEWQDWRKRSR